MSHPWTGSRLDLHLDIDLDDVVKRRAALESALREAIRAGRLGAGTLLPSSRGLAEQLGVSRGTVTSAYGQLVEEGYLTARNGSGTRVAEVPTQAADVPPVGPAGVPLRHDLRPGLPDISSFPVRSWLAATRRVLSRARPEVFGAGDPQGRRELRVALAGYLGRTRGVLASADQVVITNGYHQSAGLLSRMLLEQGAETVAAEDPGHNVYRAILERSSLAVAPLPVDDRGAQVDALTGRTAAAFLTPAHQYPTGVPLHPARRQALCAWARSHGGIVVEDDYDGEFRYDRQPVSALQGMAPEQVVYCGSTSKTLGPALRLGWMVLPRHVVADAVRVKQEADLFTETLGQLVLADILAGHVYDRHVRAARLRYRRRRELLVERTARFRSLTAQGVPAGLHVLFRLSPHGPGEAEILAACAARGLGIRGFAELRHDPAGRDQGLMIGFAAPSEHGYPAALDVLVEVLREVGVR